MQLAGLMRLGMQLLQPCFRRGTPLLVLGGAKAIDRLVPGQDRVLARSEFDPAGPLEYKLVEEVFERVGRIANIHAGGQVIGTTMEHRFYVAGKGWLECAHLQPGDRFLSHDGQWVTVEEVYDTGEYDTVYNVRVAEYHTYFVGSEEWGFSVWAHNTCTPQEAARRIQDLRQLRQAEGINAKWRVGIDKEIDYFNTFVSGKFVETTHVTPARGAKLAVTRTVYKNTADFDGGVPAFVDPTPGAVHIVVKNKLASGYTNKQLMLEGYAPIGRDGKPINLHHLMGTEPGPMMELMQSPHQTHTARLHEMIQHGTGVHATRKVEASYERWAEKWWKQRANDF